MTTRRALVFGGSGFIGRSLTTRLADRGWSVQAVAVTDRDQASRLDSEQLDIVEVTRLDPGGISTALDAADPTVVFNLMAGGVDPSDRDHRSLVDDNVGFVAALLTALEGSNGTKVIHTGSWSEYADPLGTEPIDEDHPILPTSVYGAAKAAASILGSAMSRGLGIPFLVCRLFNVYGPGEAGHRLIPYVVDRLTQRLPVELTTGVQVRDFIHVEDVADGLVGAAEIEITSAMSYNVATGIGTPVREVAMHAANALDADPDLLRFGAIESRPDEPDHIVGDPSRLFEATGWRASVVVADGVRHTVEALVEQASRLS